MADNNKPEDFTIPAEFTKEDLKTILESLEDWEAKDGLLYTIEKLKQMRNPEEGEVPDDFREAFVSFRTYMLNQEGEARMNKELRRERATLLKAKIILMNQRKAAEKAFDNALDDAPPWLSKEKKQ